LSGLFFFSFVWSLEQAYVELTTLHFSVEIIVYLNQHTVKAHPAYLK